MPKIWAFVNTCAFVDRSSLNEQKWHNLKRRNFFLMWSEISVRLARTITSHHFYFWIRRTLFISITIITIRKSYSIQLNHKKKHYFSGKKTIFVPNFMVFSKLRFLFEIKYLVQLFCTIWTFVPGQPIPPKYQYEFFKQLKTKTEKLKKNHD